LDVTLWDAIINLRLSLDGQIPQTGRRTPELLTETVKYIGLFVLLMIWIWLTEKKSINTIGIPIRFDAKSLNNFGKGAVAGLVYVAGYCLLVAATGKGRIIINGLAAFGQTLASAGLIMMVVVAEVLFCESLFRGYILEKLLGKFGRATAVAVTSGLNATFMGILSWHNPYVWLIVANSFILSVILCLMAIGATSLMPSLGKEMAFGLAQGILFSHLNHLETPSIANLSVDQSIFAGTPGAIASSAAFTIVLIAGLIYEVRHLKAHGNHK
jgi:membrane protease YdiL (CAAX protease family)